LETQQKGGQLAVEPPGIHECRMYQDCEGEKL
jgi:hypothetical protein